MISISVEMNTDGLLNALTRVEQIIREENRQIPLKSAKKYRDIVERAVVTQAYGNFGKPYHPKYKKRKLKKVGHLDFWRFHGDFLRSLGLFKVKNGWGAGIVPGSIGRDGKLIKMYAVPTERLRPLFELTRNYYKSDEWLVMMKIVEYRIRKAWR